MKHSSRLIGLFAFIVSLVFEADIGLRQSLQADEIASLGQLDEVVLKGLKREQCPGASVAVVHGGEIVHLKGYGIANLDTQVPVSSDMLFRVGSTTKMFTSAAALILAEEGKLKFDQPISELVPDALLDPSIGRLTLHQLLTHTTGLADPNAMNGPHDESALAERIGRLGPRDFFDEPGQVYSYSNAGYWTAGYVVERVSGKYYANFVDERLFDPLGMVRSTFRPTEAMTWPIAVGHGPESDEPPFVVRPLADNAEAWPAGQMFSSAPEFARFCIAFMNKGSIDGKQIIAPEIVDEMSLPLVEVPNDDRYYGYGLSIRDVNGLRWVSHSGSRTGYGSHVRMCPEKKFAVIILCNKTGVSLTAVADMAAKLVLGIEPEPLPKNEKLEITADERRGIIGTYTNAGNRLMIVDKDGKLFDGRGRQIERVGDNRYVARAAKGFPTSELSIVYGENHSPRYLMIRGRAYKKQSP